MKKNMGPITGLYPTPVTIVGTFINGKINWMNVSHIGIIGMDKMMLSIYKGHYTNIGIRQNKTVSINLVTEEMIVEADYVGIVSGTSVDKSDVFEYFSGKLKHAPLIQKSPLCMECELVDIYETSSYDNFIVQAVNTYVDEHVITDGRIDYEKIKPVLFEMPNKQYLSTGKVIAPCWNIGNNYIKK